jgi:hypothetical protein
MTQGPGAPEAFQLLQRVLLVLALLWATGDGLHAEEDNGAYPPPTESSDSYSPAPEETYQPAPEPLAPYDPQAVFPLEGGPDAEGAPTSGEIPPPQGGLAPAAPQLASPLQVEPAILPPDDLVSPPEENLSAESMTHYDPKIPKHEQIRPNFAFFAAGSRKALGPDPILPGGNADTRISGISLGWEWQPAALQTIGVPSIGVTGTLYPIAPMNTVTDAPFSLWSVGAQFRYQGRFFRKQPLVPFAGYEFSYFRYNFFEANSSNIATGPIFGAMLFLNFFSRTESAEIYVNHGVLRSYLLAEVRTLTTSDPIVSFGGSSLYFGIRLEY